VNINVPIVLNRKIEETDAETLTARDRRIAALTATQSLSLA